MQFAGWMIIVSLRYAFTLFIRHVYMSMKACSPFVDLFAMH